MQRDKFKAIPYNIKAVKAFGIGIIETIPMF